MIPYGLVVLGAVLVLCYRHVRAPYTSVRSKRAVAGLTAATFAVPYVWPLAGILALPLQLLICLYVIFYRMVMVPEETAEAPAVSADRVPESRR
jgi:hypothetical protein